MPACPPQTLDSIPGHSGVFQEIILCGCGGLIFWFKATSHYADKLVSQYYLACPPSCPYSILCNYSLL